MVRRSRATEAAGSSGMTQLCAAIAVAVLSLLLAALLLPMMPRRDHGLLLRRIPASSSLLYLLSRLILQSARLSGAPMSGAPKSGMSGEGCACPGCNRGCISASTLESASVLTCALVSPVCMVQISLGVSAQQVQSPRRAEANYSSGGS